MFTYKVLILTFSIAVVLFFIIRYIIKTYNKLKYFQNEIEYLVGKMKIPIQKKIDLLPELVALLKRQTKFEKSLLTEIAALRGSFIKSGSVKGLLKLNSAINVLVYKVNEKYPFLGSNKQFINISRQIQAIENRIEKIRYKYNGQISNYNKLVRLFPSNLVAKLFGFKPLEFFKLAEER